MSRFKYFSLVVMIPTILLSVNPSWFDSDRVVASVIEVRSEHSKAMSYAPLAIRPVAEDLKLEHKTSVVVAIVDTGIDPNHPDLKSNLWRDPHTGIYGWDFVLNKANPLDEHGHGTHVAGIISAAVNSTKFGLVTSMQNVSIMAVRYYSEKSSGADNLKNSIRALNWAIDHGAHVINYSGGGPEFSLEEYTAIRKAQEKGILIVAAAGNEKSNADLTENYYYPCAYKLENIVCVAAVTQRNDLLPSSNWGPQHIDVAAPGENILSTIPGGKYGYMSGTSQATAFGTRVAAMLLAKNPYLKPSTVKSILRAAVDPLEKLQGKVFSGGRLNSATALAVLDHRTPPAGFSVVAEGGGITTKTANRAVPQKRMTAGRQKIVKQKLKFSTL